MTSERSWFLSFRWEKCVILSLLFSSLLFSFFLSNVVVVVVVLFVPYPLTVSEYLELVLLRVVNGTLGE